MKLIITFFVCALTFSINSVAQETLNAGKNISGARECLSMATKLAFAAEGEHGNLTIPGLTNEVVISENELDRAIDYVFIFKVGGGEIERWKVSIQFSSEQKKCYLESIK